jgi:hypothetical protein
MNCEQANQFDLVEFLDKLGYQPNKVSNNDYWYLSPLREEQNPSFKINRQRIVGTIMDWEQEDLWSILSFGILPVR